MIRIFLSVVVLLSAGCSEQLKDYVRSRPGEHDIPPVGTVANGPQQRISAGAGMSVGTQAASHFSLTTSQRQVTGSQVSSKISFSQARPQ